MIPRALLLTARDDGIVTNRNCGFYACFAALPLRINVTHYGLWQRLKHAPGQHRHRRPRPDQRRPRFPASSLSALANGTVRSLGALRNGGDVHQSTPNTGPSHVTNVSRYTPDNGKGEVRIRQVEVAGISFFEDARKGWVSAPNCPNLRLSYSRKRISRAASPVVMTAHNSLIIQHAKKKLGWLHPDSQHPNTAAPLSFLSVWIISLSSLSGTAFRVDRPSGYGSGAKGALNARQWSDRVGSARCHSLGLCIADELQ